MFHALTRLFHRARDTSQLELGVSEDIPRDAAQLLARLRRLGLERIERCHLTHNRNVMVSFGAGELRVHEGYLAAPEEVQRAIVAFVEGRTRAIRRSAQRIIVAFPVVSTRAPARREQTHDDDVELAAQLTVVHQRYNDSHFEGRLKPVRIRVSRRMKSRLGHYSAAGPDGAVSEIAISRAHVRHHGWAEALQTLLHEMVHQWQDESGLPVDHGATFRARCRQVGIAPHARRALAARPRGTAREWPLVDVAARTG